MEVFATGWSVRILDTSADRRTLSFFEQATTFTALHALDLASGRVQTVLKTPTAFHSVERGKGAPRDSAAQQAVLWQGDALEVRGERFGYLQVYDHRRERAGYVLASQVRGSSLPICDLGKLLGLPEPVEERRRRFVVVAALGNRRLGLVVDHLFGQEDIVIKPLGNSLSRVRGFAGATELGDQRVGLVLDSGAVIEEVLSGAEAPRERLSLMHG